jgi:zinc finger-like protein
MATPGGVAVLPNSVNKVDSSSLSSSKACLSGLETKSPILIFLFFHKAIRNELDALHRSAMAFATGNRSDIRPLLDSYHFLRLIYKHHSNAEVEVHFL